MKVAAALLLCACALLGGCAGLARPAATHPVGDLAALETEVRETERAFAHTMAARDFAAFQHFLSDEALFLNGSQALRGRAAVAAAWRGYFDGPAAPFAWQPDTIQVLASGDLALSSGPVTGPAGESYGRFNSVWRREAGIWRIVFDRGEAPCPCRAAP